MGDEGEWEGAGRMGGRGRGNVGARGMKGGGFCENLRWLEKESVCLCLCLCVMFVGVIFE